MLQELASTDSADTPVTSTTCKDKTVDCGLSNIDNNAASTSAILIEPGNGHHNSETGCCNTETENQATIPDTSISPRNDKCSGVGRVLQNIPKTERHEAEENSAGENIGGGGGTQNIDKDEISHRPDKIAQDESQQSSEKAQIHDTVAPIKTEVQELPIGTGSRRTYKRITSLQCDKCPFKGINKGSIRRHKVRMHTEKKYKCNFCKGSYAMQGDLNNHVRNCHTSTSATVDPVILEVPSAETELHNETENHESTHTSPKKSDNSSKSAQLKCDQCPFEGTSKSSLIKHKMREHKPKKFACRLCERSFAVFSDLSQHSVKIHNATVTKPPASEELQPLNTYTKAEVAAMNSEDKPNEFLHVFRCEDCMYVGTLSGLRSHMRRHHRDCNFRCQHCPFSCSQQSDLNVHVGRCHLDGQGNVRPETVVLNTSEDGDVIGADAKAYDDFADMRKKCNGIVQRRSLMPKRSGDATSVHTCHVCGFKASKVTLLKSHMVRQHCEKKRFRCHLCLKVGNH